MSLQTSKAGKLKRAAKSEAEQPVKKIALPKKASSKAEPAQVAPVKTAKTKATAQQAAPSKATSTKAGAATSKAGGTKAGLGKIAAPKQLKLKTEGTYTTRTGQVRKAKIVGYEERRNGLWMQVKNEDGTTNQIRAKLFTPNAA